MIEVTIDASHATAEEIEAFYALQGVGRAMDSLAHEGRGAGVRLSMVRPHNASEIQPGPIDFARPH